MPSDTGKAREPRPPRLIIGGVYSSEDIMWNCGISRRTLQAWKRMGLRPIPGTSTELFLADDVVKLRETVEPLGSVAKATDGTP